MRLARAGDRLRRLVTTRTSITLAGVSLLLSLLAMWVCVYVAGADPYHALTAMFRGAFQSRWALTSTLSEWVAITLSGLAVLIPYRAGFFNVGGQGQLEMGGLAAAVVIIYFDAAPALVMAAALAACVLAGAVTVGLPLLLRLGRGASEVTTTIMVNFAALRLMYAMITGPLQDPGAWYGTTPIVPSALRLQSFPAGSGIPVGLFVAVGLAVGAWWLLNSTVFGLHLRAVGGNRPAAAAAGIPAERVLIKAVLLGAALAGLAGGFQYLGHTFRVAEGWSKTWGLVGIPVALLGGSPLGVLLVGFLFAVLETGSRSMQALTGVPAALVFMFQGLPVIIYLALGAGLRRMGKAADSK
ncbi:MAG TPA: hypothetical protein VLK32_05140 [Bacillota bacterium]|nr:hypothetical protein [Bacillota bacterium]